MFAGATVAHLTDPILAGLALLTGLAIRHVAVLFAGPFVLGSLLLALNATRLAQQQLSPDWPAAYYLGAFLACAIWITAGWFLRRAFSKQKA